eukprot:s279_g27.t1
MHMPRVICDNVARRCASCLYGISHYVFLHLFNGNGMPKGNQKGKGKGKYDMRGAARFDSQEYLDAIREALPEAARLCSQTTLVRAEWSVDVYYHQHLTSRGGVAVCPREALPELLSRVGYTGQPTAVLLVQSPEGLCAYPRDFVTCSLLVLGLKGEVNVVTAKRWLGSERDWI